MIAKISLPVIDTARLRLRPVDETIDGWESDVVGYELSRADWVAKTF